MTVITKTISPCAPDKTACACGECGGLECLCRPRFFAGQLLTEEDLNRLDGYMRTRFRMHNLSLHGTGVVNGLKVLCDPCGEVKVTVGHAVSPCGDDIILCENTRVAICDLIQKCKQSERKKLDCDPPRRLSDDTCADSEEEWVLAVKYDERATRGVMPLRTGTCSGCGSSGSTCGCADCDCDACSDPPAMRDIPKPRGAAQNCEPSVICEGYRFCVYRKPDRDGGDDSRFEFFNRDSELIKQLRCCIDILTATFPTLPDGLDNAAGTSADLRQWAKICCQFRANLIDYFSRHPHTNCALLDRLAALRCPDPNQPDGFGQAFLAALLTLLAIWLDAIKQCICLALLPPAPAPTCEDRVPLATVRVRDRDCKVLSICNWTTERDMMISWPSVTYWLGSLGIWSFLRDAIDNICCSSLADIFDDVERGDQQTGVTTEIALVRSPIAGGPPPENIGIAPAAAGAPPSAPNFADQIDQTWRGVMDQLGLGFGSLNLDEFVAENVANFDQPMSLTSVLSGLGPKFRFGQTARQLSQTELASMPETIAMEFFGRPIVASIAGLAGNVQTKASAPQKADDGEKVAAMQVEIERQRSDIELLKLAMTKYGE